MALPYVAQCAVVAQPHPKWDERPVVVAVLAPGGDTPLSPGHDELLALVRTHCASSFAKYVETLAMAVRGMATFESKSAAHVSAQKKPRLLHVP